MSNASLKNGRYLLTIANNSHPAVEESAPFYVSHRDARVYDDEGIQYLRMSEVTPPFQIFLEEGDRTGKGFIAYQLPYSQVSDRGGLIQSNNIESLSGIIPNHDNWDRIECLYTVAGSSKVRDAFKSKRHQCTAVAYLSFLGE